MARSYGQGQVVFANKVGNVVDAPVFLPSNQSGPGPTWSAQLYLQGSDASLTPLVPASSFRAAGTGAASIADRYWVNQTIDVPSVAPGQLATFVVRLFQTSYGSYDAAANAGAMVGTSAPFVVAVGGGILPPANLTTLQSYAFVLPEPSLVELLVAGGGLMVVGRWKRQADRRK